MPTVFYYSIEKHPKLPRPAVKVCPELPISSQALQSLDWRESGRWKNSVVDGGEFLAWLLIGSASDWREVGRAEWPFSVLLVAGCGRVRPYAAKGEAVATNSKHVIGATATITEATAACRSRRGSTPGRRPARSTRSSGRSRIRAKRPSQNIGKSIRVLIKNEKGDEAWVDAVIAGRVRVRSSVQDEDDYHGRYKVRLPLEWNGVKKEVLVTINDRTDMDYPLLVGRNFLRGDFVVDVDVDNADGRTTDE